MSAASLGSVAGLPWVFFLQGPLVSVVLAVFAVLRADQLWRATTGRFRGPLAGIALASAVAVGHPASSTWPDRCFELLLSNGKEPRDWLLVLALIGVGALVCLVALDFELRRRLRRLQAANVQPSDQASKFALWVGLAGLAWSVANETFLPNLPLMLSDISFGGTWAYDGDRFRDPCNPEVGWVGAALYLIALVLLWRSARQTLDAGATRERWRRDSIRAQGLVLFALLIVQAARTSALFRVELPMLKQHGGQIECGCHKYNAAAFPSGS